jgi:septum formation protein
MWIVLASASPRRKTLLSELGLTFDVIPSKVDESSVKVSSPEELVKILACLKARDVASGARKDSLVIGADTVVYLDGKVIGKPKDKDDARRTLKMLSGKEHHVYTGVCLINTAKGSESSFVVRTGLRFLMLSDNEIENYLSNENALTGAGSYLIQEQPTLAESITGSFTNVIGLPMERLVPLLKENGIAL